MVQFSVKITILMIIATVIIIIIVIMILILKIIKMMLNIYKSNQFFFCLSFFLCKTGKARTLSEQRKEPSN